AGPLRRSSAGIAWNAVSVPGCGLTVTRFSSLDRTPSAEPTSSTDPQRGPSWLTARAPLEDTNVQRKRMFLEEWGIQLPERGGGPFRQFAEGLILDGLRQGSES